MSGDVDKTVEPVSPAAGYGLREFLRKKSDSGSTRNVDMAGFGDTNGSTANASMDGHDGSGLTVEADISGSVYGNYLTVSGTGASILKDIFQKKYRAGKQEGTVAAAAEERETKKKISFGQMTFFGFRFKKEKGFDGGIPDSEVENKVKSISKSSKDGRSRHKSGPEQGYHVATGSDFESKSKPGKMRTFFDSFRGHPRPSSSADPATLVRQLRTYSPDVTHKSGAGKGKKFLVTPTRKEKEAEIGPQEFIEMYRSRAFSDSQPQDLMAARAAAKHTKLSSGFAPLGGLDVNQIESSDNKRHYVVWRDKRRGTKIYQLPSAQSMAAVRDDFGDPNDADLVFVQFLKSHSCYDLIPSSSKLVIFDTQLTVRRAFLALVQNGVRAAVLWDTTAQDFAGMLTVTDFIQVLQKYYHSSQEELSKVENNRIFTWKELLEYKQRLMVYITPESSLFDALKTLHENKVHRLLVIDDHLGNPLNLLSHKRIAKFLHQHMQYLQRPSFMDKTLEELNVGTYEKLGMLQTDAPLIEALNLFVLKRVSAIPIIDNEGRAVDMFAKIDVVGLIHEQLYNDLDVSVVEVLKSRRENFQGVLTCKKTETLQEIVDRIVTSAVHRLIVVDDGNRVVGIVSLSDILHYLVLHPSEAKRRLLSFDQLQSTTDPGPDTGQRESSGAGAEEEKEEEEDEEEEEEEERAFKTRSLLEVKEQCLATLTSHSSSNPNLIMTDSTSTVAADSTTISERKSTDESSSPPAAAAAATVASESEDISVLIADS